MNTEKNIQDIRTLATLLHDNFCTADFQDCTWEEEDWLSLEINHHRADYYDKAEKIYNYFDQNALTANKVVQFILTSPAASQFFDLLC